MSAEVYGSFHITESVLIYFTCMEPDPDNPGAIRPMNLSNGTVELELTGPPGNPFVFKKQGMPSSPGTAGKGSMLLNPNELAGLVDESRLPHPLTLKFTAFRADGFVSVQNRGRITLRP